MIFSILHFLGGYCQVVLCGKNQERFLNLCVGRQILLWRLARKDGHYIFYVSRAGAKELEDISQKTGCDHRILCKRGLPFLFGRYRKRKLFLAALLFSAQGCMCCRFFSGRFVPSAARPIPARS